MSERERERDGECKEGGREEGDGTVQLGAAVLSLFPSPFAKKLYFIYKL